MITPGKNIRHLGLAGFTVVGMPPTGSPFYVAALVLVFFCGLLKAQGQAPSPAFDVASVKAETFVPSPGRGRVVQVSCSNGHFVARNATAWYLTKWAWNIVGDNDRIAGYPDWTKDSYYQIEAKAPPPVSDARCRLMLKSLLAERFHLRAHEEQRMIDALDLVVSKGGPKITRVTDPNAPVNGPGFTISGQPTQMLEAGAKGWTMEQLAYLLRAAQLGRKVFDRTGLEGIYRIDLRFRRLDDDVGFDPDIATALRQQLGLVLRPAKEPLEVVVVDHIEHPTPN